ncbi:MAG: glutamine amidotransferase [Ruminococcaceae bacterium]|nr:glutamine amidotransferase [Oscillospiraceae bacterium]
MEIKILHMFGDVMNLYGEYANMEVMKRYLTDLGYDVCVDTLSLYERKDISGYDFYYMGSGTEKNQKRVLPELKHYEPAVKAACESGKTMLFTGNSFELLGSKITAADGMQYEGLNLEDFVTIEGKRRIVGDAIAQLGEQRFVGFINKCGKTSGIKNSLFEMRMGFGNDKEKGTEGLRIRNCFGTHLTGPIMVKNPNFLAMIAGLVIGEELPAPTYEAMKRSYETTLKALEARLSEQK